MKLRPPLFAYVRAQNLYIAEGCDCCGMVLNQSFRFTIAGRPEVYCSATCRDLTFFGDPREVKKRSTPGKCVYCGGTLKGKKRGALYCDDVCRMTHTRVRQRRGTLQVEESRTPIQSNQRVASPKTGGQGNRIAGGPQPFRNARGESGARMGSPVEVGQAISGNCNR
jgi:hypothetical protein